MAAIWCGEWLVIPEGEVALAVVSLMGAMVVHAADDADEFVANDGETGSVAKMLGDGEERGFAGDDGNGTDGRIGRRSGLFAEVDVPILDALVVEMIEGQAGGGEGRGFASTGGGDEGNPEGGTFDPAESGDVFRDVAGGDVDDGLVADDGAGEGEEGCGDEFGTGAGEECAGEDGVAEVRRKGVHRKIGKEVRLGRGIGEGEEAEMGGRGAGGIGHRWTSAGIIRTFDLIIPAEGSGVGQ